MYVAPAKTINITVSGGVTKNIGDKYATLSGLSGSYAVFYLEAGDILTVTGTDYMNDVEVSGLGSANDFFATVRFTNSVTKTITQNGNYRIQTSGTGSSGRMYVKIQVKDSNGNYCNFE